MCSGALFAGILAPHNLLMIAIAASSACCEPGCPDPIGDCGGPGARQDAAQPRREMRKHEKNTERAARVEMNAVFRWVTMYLAT